MSLPNPEGKYGKKKSNHSRDTADLQLRNNARSQCVVTGRWKYTYIYVYTEEEEEFSDSEKQEGRDISALWACDCQ